MTARVRAEWFIDLTDAILTEHAVERLCVRAISIPRVLRALAQPDRVVALRLGRVAVDHLERGRLLRLIVDVDCDPPEVVTAFETSRIHRDRSRP
jgi:hypothetical protein